MPEHEGLFIYGPLMPGELAFGHIEELIEPAKRALLLDAQIFLRDTLPMLELNQPGRSVKGYLVTPKQQHLEEFWRTIEKYLGKDNFEKRESQKVQVGSEEKSVTVFEGKEPGLGHPESLSHEWLGRKDPILSRAFPILWEKVRVLDVRTSDALHAPREYWKQIVEWESQFLMLISIFEHLTTMICGSALSKHSQARDRYLINRREITNAFALAQGAHEIPYIEVRDAGNIEVLFNSSTVESALLAWFRVRNNLTHTGKMSLHDAVLLRNSFCGLFNFVRRFLISEVSGIQDEWRDLVSTEVKCLTHPHT